MNQKIQTTRRFSNHESRLLLRSHTFAIIVILDLKIHQSMWIHWPFFPKTWTKGHWPLDDLWPHVCWGHMCDSTQGSLCPSPMTIHQCMWIQWSILQNTTYIHIHTTYYVQNEWSHSLLLNSVQARQRKPISKISADSNFTFSSYAWLCVFHFSHRLLCWIKSCVRGFSVKIAHFILKWFQPNSFGEVCFLEECNTNMKKKIAF